MCALTGRGSAALAAASRADPEIQLRCLWSVAAVDPRPEPSRTHGGTDMRINKRHVVKAAVELSLAVSSAMRRTAVSVVTATLALMVAGGFNPARAISILWYTGGIVAGAETGTNYKTAFNALAATN